MTEEPTWFEKYILAADENTELRAEVERLTAALDLAQRMLANRERELQAVRRSLASLPAALEPKP
jgi:hypothetical protein